jgi:hypothetical protein
MVNVGINHETDERNAGKGVERALNHHGNDM